MAEQPRKGKVTVVGAGFYGSTTALRLAEYDIFETVVLTDIVEGKPEGLALDMNQSRPIEGFETRVVGVGGGSYEGTEGSDVVVVTAGLPRKPGMSRMDLIETNAKIVREVSENIARTSPDAVVIVVSNPLDEMTALAQLATGFPKQRVMGQAGMLDTARFSNFVAEELGVPVTSVRTLTLGSHGDTMVPVPSRCTVDGKPLSDVLAADRIDALVDRTRNGGAEVVALLKTGSAYYAPSAAAARMASPACTWASRPRSAARASAAWSRATCPTASWRGCARRPRPSAPSRPTCRTCDGPPVRPTPDPSGQGLQRGMAP
jgi:malate dehydrogenase